MKWTPIAKAKPKFKQLYICKGPERDGFWLGTLAESKVTPDGVEHLFFDGDLKSPATHVAAVTDPANESE